MTSMERPTNLAKAVIDEDAVNTEGSDIRRTNPDPPVNLGSATTSDNLRMPERVSNPPYAPPEFNGPEVPDVSPTRGRLPVRSPSESRRSRSRSRSIVIVERSPDSNYATRAFARHINGLGSRISRLERNAGFDGRLPKTRLGKNIHVLPKLNRIHWHAFKNNLESSQEELSAIDVLEGPARYFYNLKEDRSNRAKRTAFTIPSPDEEAITHDQQLGKRHEMPERIRINSASISAVLDEIFPDEMFLPLGPLVMLRPYKSLVHYEKEIREYFDELSKKWEHVDKETLATLEKESEQDKPIDSRKKFTDSLEAYRDMRCLIEFIDNDIRPTMEYFKSGTATKVRFHELWCLFQSGQLVYTPTDQKGEAKEATDPTQATNRSTGQQAQFPQKLFMCIVIGGSRPFLQANPNPDKIPYSTTRERHHAFGLGLYYIDFQGVDFGPISQFVTIWPFDGEKEITSLIAFPLHYAPNAAQIRETLVARGKKYYSMTGVRHLEYNGPTYSRGPNGEEIKADTDYVPPRQYENVQARVVVDIKTSYARTRWLRHNRQIPRNYLEEPRVQGEDYPWCTWKDSEMTETAYVTIEEIHKDDHVDVLRRTNLTLTDPFLAHWCDHDTKYISEHMTDDMLMLLPNMVPGYVLRNREFVMLDVDHLRDIRPDLDGFDNLQLRHGQKEMVQALVNTHFRERSITLSKQQKNPDAHKDLPDMDIVEGKGKGLVILLHGAPGVGKTSTAECVAEQSRKPLLPIICGDLGITAADVEDSLEGKFELAQKWNCVLLLDEADIFLAQRTKTDLERNALVSVFLRVLEYCTGILFLTTNRVGTFDEAFRSRIHMTLYYPPLDEDQTKRIWSMNLHRILKRKEGKLEASEPELINYAIAHYWKNHPKKTTWNGRQIRNAFQTAVALAEWDAYDKSRAEEGGATPNASMDLQIPVAKLQVKHFDIVAEAAVQFDEYIEETIQFNQQERAYQARERSDHFNWRHRGGSRTLPVGGHPYDGRGDGSDYGGGSSYLQFAPREDQPWSMHTPSRGGGGYERDSGFYERKTPGLGDRLHDGGAESYSPGMRRSPGPPGGGYDGGGPGAPGGPGYDGGPVSGSGQRVHGRGAYDPTGNPQSAGHQRGQYPPGY